MAMTELALLFIGALATLATLGLFVNIEDQWTQVVITFLAAVLWGLFGMSSFDVVIDDAATVSEPIMPLAILGIGLAAMVALYGFYGFVSGFRESVTESDPELFS